MPKTTIYLVFVLTIAIFGAFFAFENQDSMAVQLGRWTWQSSEALIILIAFGIGLLLAGLASVPSLVSRSMEIRSLKAKMKKKDAELDELQNQKEAISKKLDRLTAEKTKAAKGIEEISAD